MKSKLLAAAAACSLAIGVSGYAYAQENGNHDQMKPGAEHMEKGATGAHGAGNTPGGNTAGQRAENPGATRQTGQHEDIGAKGAQTEPTQRGEGKAAEAPRNEGTKAAETPRHEGNNTAETNQHKGTNAAETNQHNGTNAAETNQRKGTNAAETNQHNGTNAAESNQHKGTNAAETNQHKGTNAAETNRHEGTSSAEGNRREGTNSAETNRKGDTNAAEGNRGAGANRRAEAGNVRVNGRINVSHEKASRVSETLMQRGHRENLNISVNVGARLPETVALYPVPEDIVEIAPEYRGYDYVIDNDEIVFVQPSTHEVVGTIEYEGRAAAADESSVNIRRARPCPPED